MHQSYNEQAKRKIICSYLKFNSNFISSIVIITKTEKERKKKQYKLHSIRNELFLMSENKRLNSKNHRTKRNTTPKIEEKILNIYNYRAYE